MRDRSRLFMTAMAAMAALLVTSESAWAFNLRLQLYFPLSRRSRSGNVVKGAVASFRDPQKQPCQTHHLIRTAVHVTMGGDPFREATGIRPSLHPTTINAIAEALKARARQVEGMHFQVSNKENGNVVQPIDVAVTAGKIASTAITNRRNASEGDGMQLTLEEEQTIAGRILGVVMRLEDIEETLHERVSAVGWVEKYNEWSTFGVLKSEGKDDKSLVGDRIKADPLFAVSRAECLLAIFLATVEVPQLEKVGEKVPDGSKIDFLDSDRMEVLLPDEQ